MAHRRRLAVLLVLPLGLQGCASLTVDADGTRHLTGFMRLTLPPPAAGAVADKVRVQAIGLTWMRSPAVGTSIVLGYGDTALTVLRTDDRGAVAAPAGKRTLAAGSER